MLPLTLLRSVQAQAMLVELKNGDTYNGRLETCDGWMNIKLSDVIWTSRDGDRFWKLEEAYVRGSSIKYMTIPDEVLDMVAVEEEASARERRASQRGRGRGRGSSFRGRGEKGRGTGGRGGRSDRGRGRGRGGRD